MQLVNITRVLVLWSSELGTFYGSPSMIECRKHGTTLHVVLYRLSYTGCANKKQYLGKIHFLSYCKRFFSSNLQLSWRRIQATYTANFATIFAMVKNLQPFELKIKSAVF